MKTKVAITSINCYKNHIKGWRENSENKIIYDTIKRIQPCTGRMIQKETGIEIGDVARSLNNLWYKLKPAHPYKSYRKMPNNEYNGQILPYRKRANLTELIT